MRDFRSYATGGYRTVIAAPIVLTLLFLPMAVFADPLPSWTPSSLTQTVVAGDSVVFIDATSLFSHCTPSSSMDQPYLGLLIRFSNHT